MAEFILKQVASEVQRAIDNALNPDATLKKSGIPADAKAVGDALASKWLGKTINFLGDSITEGYASDVCYVDILAEQLGAVCNNYGIGGSTIANGQNPMHSRALQMDEDADLVLVFGGTNDFANYDRALGTQFNIDNNKRTLNLDTNTFYGGLNQLCTNLYSRFPYSTLVLCTPLNRQSFAGQETDLQANGNGLYLDEYVEAIKKVAAYFSIPCLDLYATANLHPYDAANIAKYYSASDQLHPNAEGHRHLANVMIAFLRTLADKRGRIIENDSHIHNYTSKVITAATCTANGVKTFTCTCGESYTETIPATGHSYVDGICTVCGAVDPDDYPDEYPNEYSASDTSGVLEIKEAGFYDLNGTWSVGAEYVSWKLPCSAGEEWTQYSTSTYGMYKTFWDADGNLIASLTPNNGNPTSFIVPDDNNIVYMWTAIKQSDIDDSSYRLVRNAALKDEEVTLPRISATYSGGAVVVGTAVDDLTDIVVTVMHSDGSTEVVSGYTLSGTIADGSNTITVSYEGLTTTFAVTGFEAEVLEHLAHSFTAANATSEVWVDEIDGSYQFDFIGSPTVENGLITFSNSSGGVLNKSLAMGSMDATLAIGFAVDTTMQHTWVLGTPNWSNGVIIGRHTNRFAVDSKLGNVYLNMDDGDVHDFVLSYAAEANKISVYFDGAHVGTLSGSGVGDWLSGLLKLNDEAASYKGANSVRDIRIFDKALTEDEVLALCSRTKVKLGDYTASSGWVFNNSGEVFENAEESWVQTCETYIPVSSGEEYAIAFDSVVDRMFVYGYDENKAGTGWITNGAAASGFIVPSGTAYVRIGCIVYGVESVAATLYELCEEG